MRHRRGSFGRRSFRRRGFKSRFKRRLRSFRPKRRAKRQYVLVNRGGIRL